MELGLAAQTNHQEPGRQTQELEQAVQRAHPGWEHQTVQGLVDQRVLMQVAQKDHPWLAQAHQMELGRVDQRVRELVDQTIHPLQAQEHQMELGLAVQTYPLRPVHQTRELDSWLQTNRLRAPERQMEPGQGYQTIHQGREQGIQTELEQGCQTNLLLELVLHQRQVLEPVAQTILQWQEQVPQRHRVLGQVDQTSLLLLLVQGLQRGLGQVEPRSHQTRLPSEWLPMRCPCFLSSNPQIGVLQTICFHIASLP
mmetsp:Transcript_8238/g.17547  ORF Transcript_8238/g.17547 Transcript_8238/m.17547 type:complete len:254 (-) Transcript_8238:1012-1773(-)